MRQIPYTMMKFACFERTVEALYKFVVPKPRSECSKPEQLVVTFVAGYIGELLATCMSVKLRTSNPFHYWPLIVRKKKIPKKFYLPIAFSMPFRIPKNLLISF